MKKIQDKIKFFVNSVFWICVLIVFLSLISGLTSSFLKVHSEILFVVIFMIFMAAALIAVISGAFSFVIDGQTREADFVNIQLTAKKHNGQWEKRNEQGRCGSCNAKFTSGNPDFGGGQCRNCWASWG